MWRQNFLLFDPCETWTFRYNCQIAECFDLCFMHSNLLGLLVPFLFFFMNYIEETKFLVIQALWSWIFEMQLSNTLSSLSVCFMTSNLFGLVVLFLFLHAFEEANFLVVQALWNLNFEIHLSYLLKNMWFMPLNLFGPVVSWWIILRRQNLMFYKPCA